MAKESIKKSTVLDTTFFSRPTCMVAHDLLGKYLVRRVRGKERAYFITETEAYDGPCDRANHASRGRTSRTEVMFGPAGCWYVYLCYGMHWMLNIVTGPTGYPAAVLIRGIEEADGPGKLTKLVGVTQTQNAKPAIVKTGLWIEDRGVCILEGQIRAMPRVGVAYAKEWADKPWRYVYTTPFLVA